MLLVDLLEHPREIRGVVLEVRVHHEVVGSLLVAGRVAGSLSGRSALLRVVAIAYGRVMRKLTKSSAVRIALATIASLTSSCGDVDSCVEEGTLVETADGPLAIETLRVGDSVLSVDPGSGAKFRARVTHTRSAWAWCRKLQLDEGHVWLTAEHPLYSPELGAFEPAERWFSGELVQTLGRDGQLVATDPGTWFERRPCRVIDLTVSSAPHTFVANGIVVHNKSMLPECVTDADCATGEECLDSSNYKFCVPADVGGDNCPVDPLDSPNSTCIDGARCSYGEETCCGQTFTSLECSCEAGTWSCYFTDACLGAIFMCPEQYPCSAEQCPSPAPGAPNVMCEDGSVGGPVCERNEEAECVWSIRECPDEP